ncbi:MAG: hypothetical protein ACK4RZ_00135 [Paracoccaceae bacterium]
MGSTKYRCSRSADLDSLMNCLGTTHHRWFSKKANCAASGCIGPAMTAPVRWISLFWICSAVCFSAHAGYAQDASKMGQTWQHFLVQCGLAYSDPQRYLRSTADERGPSSSFVGSTADGQMVWGGRSGDFNSDGYGVIVVGNRRLQSCEAYGLLDGNVATSAAVNEAFLQDLTARPGVVFSGGAMPETKLGAGGGAVIGVGTYRYVVLGALPDQILAEVTITPWQMEIYSTHSDGGP